MRQLVQLQEHVHDFEDLNAEIVVVFREEKEGAEGLAKVREKTNTAATLLLDLDAQETPEYSAEGFSTYLIDPAGVVQAELTGSVMNRPTADEILAKLRSIVPAKVNP